MKIKYNNGKVRQKIMATVNNMITGKKSNKIEKQDSMRIIIIISI